MLWVFSLASKIGTSPLSTMVFSCCQPLDPFLNCGKTPHGKCLLKHVTVDFKCKWKSNRRKLLQNKLISQHLTLNTTRQARTSVSLITRTLNALHKQFAHTTSILINYVFALFLWTAFRRVNQQNEGEGILHGEESRTNHKGKRLTC